MSTDTRQRLINIIIDSYYSAEGKKLQVGKVADEAGITRQAFHRYYSDLLGYIKKEKPIDELLPGTNQDSVKKLLVQCQSRVETLEQELLVAEDRHKNELRKALDKHITSLMNNDITLFDTDEVRVALEKQTTLIQHYVAQINELKAQLTKNKISISNQKLSSTRGSRISFEPTLKPAMASYRKDNSHNNYLEIKSKEIAKQLIKVNSFTARGTKLIIFIDNYLCEFTSFLETLPPPTTTEIVFRLPIFTAIELKNLIRNITSPFHISVHIPACTSIAEANAQRKFRSSDVPFEELKLAEKADHIYLIKGIDSVVYFDVQNGK